MTATLAETQRSHHSSDSSCEEEFNHNEGKEKPEEDPNVLAAQEAKKKKIKAQQALIKKNREVLEKMMAARQAQMNKTQKSKSSPSVLHLDQLVVNQAPDVELTCDLACISKEHLAESLLDQRIRFLDKIGNAKDKLDI